MRAAGLMLTFTTTLLCPNALIGAVQTEPTGQAVRRAVEEMSKEEIVGWLRASGLSRFAIEERLRRAGYDLSLAKPYLDAMAGGSGGEVDGSGVAFAEALESIGLPGDSRADLGEVEYGWQVSHGSPSGSAQEAAQAAMDTLPGVFGLDVFRRRSSEFAPVLTGPVGPDYVLGPGDEVVLVVTGDVELAQRLSVTREGTLLIPDVGQVSVNGLTVAALERRLESSLGEVYGAIRSGSAQFTLSLGRLRTSQVRVVGAVVRPGAYQVSSLSTVLEALYMAGGPSEPGSFRNISVLRGGGEAATLDLYPYLTVGRTEGDIRLHEGDVVFVPVSGPRTTITGMVRRPAVFELVEGEGLPAAIRYAGGLLPDARHDRVQVDRILAPADRVEGRDRVLLDAPLDQILAGSAEFDLRDGDEIRVFEILPRVRQRVSISGAVWRPGAYQLRPGTTVAALVNRAGGLVEDALSNLAQLVRMDLSDGTQTMMRLDLATDGGLLLQEFDEVTVFGRDALLEPDSVSVYGFVRSPGIYPRGEGMTVTDLVLLAGGFARGALPWSAEIVRRDRSFNGENSVAVALQVGLPRNLPYPDTTLLTEFDADQAGLRPASEVVLLDGDEVFIRRLPRYEPIARVTVEGAVVSPGPYGLTRRDERLSSVLSRSGGFADDAYPRGLRLMRDGIPVGVAAEEALASPGTEADPVLQGGDVIVVPVEDNTVAVQGAVLFEARTTFRPGMGLEDVIAAAGGFAQDADRGRISVEYANGTRDAVRKRLWLFRNDPEIEPGATVFVPRKTEGRGFDWDSALSRTLAVLSTFATVYIATTR